MSQQFTITVTDEVAAALQKKATEDGLTVQELIDNQMLYYIGCALYDHMKYNNPVNTPGLSIQERIQVYAVGVTDGEQAARELVDTILSSR